MAFEKKKDSGAGDAPGKPVPTSRKKRDKKDIGAYLKMKKSKGNMKAEDC